MLAKSYKLLFDISVCYTIGAFLLSYVGGIAINGISFLVLLFTALVSILPIKNQTFKMIATILIPFLSLAFFLPTLPELVVLIPICGYCFYVTITKRSVIGRGEFVDRLKWIRYLFVFLAFMMLTAFQRFSTAVQVAGPYLITALVSAIFLLRHLRAVNQMEQRKQYIRQQFFELLAFLVICLLLTLAKAPQNLVEGLKLMYLHLLVPVMSLLVRLIGIMIYGLIYLLLAGVSSVTRDKEMEDVKYVFGRTLKESIEKTEANIAGTDWLTPLMYAIGAIVSLVLLFFFFRWLMGEKLKQNMPTGILETREYLVDVEDKKSTSVRKRPTGSRAAVRYYYWKCLLWLQHKRVRLRPQDTTDEINDKCINIGQANRNAASSHLFSEDFMLKREASAQLKLIYRKARYQMTEEVTKEEAEKAKQLYQRIKTSKKVL